MSYSISASLIPPSPSGGRAGVTTALPFVDCAIRRELLPRATRNGRNSGVRSDLGGNLDGAAPLTESRVERWRRYSAQVHWPFVAVMTALTLTLGLAGLGVLPTDSQPLPGARYFIVLITTTPKLRSPSVLETLYADDAADPVDSQASHDWFLDITPHVRHVTWNLSFTRGLQGGRPCSGDTDKPTTKKVEDGTLTYVYRTSGKPLHLSFCWPHNSPVRSEGPYLSAEFPEVGFLGPAAPKFSVEKDLVTAGLGGDYVLQGGKSPTTTSNFAWEWRTVVPSRLVSVALNQLVFATSLGGVARDSRNAFLAGVLFGIAGGALVAVIGELFLPLRLRRRRSGRQAGERAG